MLRWSVRIVAVPSPDHTTFVEYGVSESNVWRCHQTKCSAAIAPSPPARAMAARSRRLRHVHMPAISAAYGRYFTPSHISATSVATNPAASRWRLWSWSHRPGGTFGDRKCHLDDDVGAVARIGA